MIIIQCPHCGGDVEIEAFNCCIFRHGADNQGNQLPPHSSKESCEAMLGENRGCGKPFKCYEKDGEVHVEICEYI